MATMRAVLLIASLGVGACGSSYELATCSFGSADASCEPIKLQDGPRDTFVLSFAVTDPNPGIAPGCAGTVDVEVNTVNTGDHEIAWHAEELDTRCMKLGDLDGAEPIDGAAIVDIAFPRRGFTFRVEVTEVP